MEQPRRNKKEKKKKATTKQEGKNKLGTIKRVKTRASDRLLFAMQVNAFLKLPAACCAGRHVL